MTNIIIIGFGNLGKRYYESISQLKEFTVKDNTRNINIFIYDPYVNANIEGVTVVNSLSIGVTIDLAIIATCADIRYTVAKELIENNKVNKIVFEKFMFLKREEYDEMKLLLHKYDIKAWVNCTRREYDAYSYIKQKLDGVVNMIVVGDNWGLCCNGIHYLDIFYFLGGKVESLRVKDCEIIDAKRPGYKEMNGTIYSSDDRFQIKSSNISSTKIVKKIWNDRYDFILVNSNNCLTVIEHDKLNNFFDTREFKIPYLSEIAKDFVTHIIEDTKVLLPTFTESCEPHVKLLDLFKKEFDSRNIELMIT